MRTNFFCTKFLNTPRDPGHPGKIPGTSQIPLFETQGRQTFEGGQEVLGHHPFAWKTPTATGSLRTQKVSLCALFSCLSEVWRCLSPRRSSDRLSRIFWGQRKQAQTKTTQKSTVSFTMFQGTSRTKSTHWGLCLDNFYHAHLLKIWQRNHRSSPVSTSILSEPCKQKTNNVNSCYKVPLQHT